MALALTNGLPVDSDGDGLADHLEDSNGNGSRDAGETDLSNPDTDDDEVNDYLEFVQGRNPLAPGSTNDAAGILNLRLYTPLH